MKLLAKILATFFGTGAFPFAPGTFASLAAALVYKFGLFRLSGTLQAVVIVVVFFVGVAAASVHARELGRPDPRPVVIDEACGQWIACFLIPPGWMPVLAAFFLFRLFDVWKPFPIRQLERLRGGWGIMADDVLAGIFAGLLVHGYLLLA
jgi:phosphatidylglycerophosphatase A